MITFEEWWGKQIFPKSQSAHPAQMAWDFVYAEKSKVISEKFSQNLKLRHIGSVTKEQLEHAIDALEKLSDNGEAIHALRKIRDLNDIIYELSKQ